RAGGRPWRGGGPEMPLARVDLRYHASLRPPRVGPGDGRIAHVQRRIEQRHRQPGRLDQVAEIALGDGSDAVGHLAQYRPEHGGTADWSALQLAGQLADRTPAELDRPRHHGTDIVE